MLPPLFFPQATSRAAEQAVLSLVRAGNTVRVGLPSGAARHVHPRVPPGVDSVTHPCAHRDHRDFRGWLAGWMRENPTALVLPIDEAVLHAAAQLEAAAASAARVIAPSAASLKAALSKYHATGLAMAAGLATPPTVFLREPGTAVPRRPDVSLPFPLLLKWDNAETTEGGYQKGDRCIVNSIEELEACLAELKPVSCGVIAQEMVPGIGVGAFFLRHRGRVVLRFAHRRIHEVPWTGGVSAACESSNDADVLAAGERLLEAIDYEGVAMVEFRQEPGKPPVFLEINGRLWGSLGLALAAGADFPRAMVECFRDGRTGVAQPDLSRKVRWHDPGLEMEYLRSLWTKAPGPVDGPPPRLRGTLRVVSHFLDPRVKSDWWRRDDLLGSAKRYLRLVHRELALIKAAGIRLLQGRRTSPLLAEAVERTRRWRQSPGSPTRLLFVCYGNICRSPYAERRWNAWQAETGTLPPAESSGFHDHVDRPTPARFQAAARHRGVELRDHRSRRLDREQLATADVVFVMDLRNLEAVLHQFPEALAKTLLLGALSGNADPEIPDPYGQPIGAGGAAYQRLDAELEVLRLSLEASRKIRGETTRPDP